jgi:hypothetical protein
MCSRHVGSVAAHRLRQRSRLFGVSYQLIDVFTPCRLGRRSPPLRGNARVGPPAMSFVHSPIFSDSISAVIEIPLQQIKLSGVKL